MIILLSPSKTMDFSPVSVSGATNPIFAKETLELVDLLKKRSRPQLKKLLNVSDKLASLNFERYKIFSKRHTKTNAKPAIFAYTGDVYQGIECGQYSKSELAFAQKHIAIISGLYGILRPLDLMQPYRLEMGTKLKSTKAVDLYSFWSEKVSKELQKMASKNKAGFILNLASNEYSSVIKPEVLSLPIINVSFKEKKGSSYKVVGILAKKARGFMTNFIVENKITNLDGVKKFKDYGYTYRADLSTDKELVFTKG